MTSRDFYEVLGVKPSSSQDEIKRAYKRLARKFHPDVNPDDKSAEEKFKEVNRAFEVLSDEQKRKVYDELGADAEKIGFDPAKAGAYRQWSSAGARDRGAGFGDFQDMGFDFDLSDLFGFGAQRRERARAPRPGADVVASMRVDFRRSVLGGEEDIVLNKPKTCKTCHGRGTTGSPKTCLACGGGGRIDMSQGGLKFTAPCSVCGGTGKQAGPPCAACGGSGSVQEPTRLKVRIPPGVKEGQKIRLAGQGAPGKNGGPAGDLLISVSVTPHKLFTREQQDLVLEVPITVSEAMRGAEIEIPTLDGPVKLKVPPGSQSGQKLRLKGKGVPGSGNREPGHLYAVLSVQVPKSKGEEANRVAEEIEKLYDADVRAKLK
jgi:molecular chaperone DnaJ